MHSAIQLTIILNFKVKLQFFILKFVFYVREYSFYKEWHLHKNISHEVCTFLESKKFRGFIKLINLKKKKYFLKQPILHRFVKLTEKISLVDPTALVFKILN